MSDADGWIHRRHNDRYQWIFLTVSPVERFTDPGVTAIETSAGLTVKFVWVLMLPVAAMMTAVPSATLVASPETLTVVTLESEEVQLTELVRFDVLPSE